MYLDKQNLILKLTTNKQQLINFIHIQKNHQHIMNTQRAFLQNKLLETELKLQQLQKVNAQLSHIIQSSQIIQYKQLLTRLSQQQSTSSQKINQLTRRISQLQVQLQFTQSRTISLISDYQHKVECSNITIKQLQRQIQSINEENNALRKQLTNKKSMLKNQQLLIDDYKRSMQQQKQIQKEINRCEMRAIQVEMNKHLQQKVKQIKQGYEKKLQKYHQIKVNKEYQKGVDSLGVFLTEKKKRYRQQQQLEQYRQGQRQSTPNQQHKQHKQQEQKQQQTNQTQQSLKNKNLQVIDCSEEKQKNKHDDTQQQHSSVFINQIIKNNKESQINVNLNYNNETRSIKKVPQSLSSTLQTSLHNYQSKTTQNSFYTNNHSKNNINNNNNKNNKNNKVTQNFLFINLLNQFNNLNQRQPLKQQTQRSNNKPFISNEKAFMTEQLRSNNNHNLNNNNEKQQFNGSFSKKSQNKVGIKSINKKKREDKENYYIIDEFREEQITCANK